MPRLEGGPADGLQEPDTTADAIEVPVFADGSVIVATYVRDRERPGVFRWVDLDAFAEDDG
jgi:hypothetical protein